MKKVYKRLFTIKITGDTEENIENCLDSVDENLSVITDQAPLDPDNYEGIEDIDIEMGSSPNPDFLTDLWFYPKK